MSVIDIPVSLIMELDSLSNLIGVYWRCFCLLSKIYMKLTFSLASINSIVIEKNGACAFRNCYWRKL